MAKQKVNNKKETANMNNQVNKIGEAKKAVAKAVRLRDFAALADYYSAEGYGTEMDPQKAEKFSRLARNHAKRIRRNAVRQERRNRIAERNFEISNSYCAMTGYGSAA